MKSVPETMARLRVVGDQTLIGRDRCGDRVLDDGRGRRSLRPAAAAGQHPCHGGETNRATHVFSHLRGTLSAATMVSYIHTQTSQTNMPPGGAWPARPGIGSWFWTPPTRARSLPAVPRYRDYFTPFVRQAPRARVTVTV